MKLGQSAMVFVLIVGVSYNALAQQQGPIIAVFDIEDKGSGILQQTMDNLMDFLSARLAKAGYRVIPRSQIRERLLDAKKETYKHCYDQSCQVELGRELAAQKTLSLKILKIGTTCQITAELYDLRQATTDLATTGEASCHNEQSLLQAFTAVSEDLSRPLLGSQRKLQDGLAEMERLARSDDGTSAERASRAWNVVKGIVDDSMIARDGKVKVLRKFLGDFQDTDQAVATAANKLLVDIDLASLSIMSSPPGAKVFLGGKQTGIAPFTTELKAGEHTVSGQLDGHEPFEAKIQIEPGEKRDLTMELRKIKLSTLVVKAKPSDAWVDIDGKTAGQVPVAKELAPGQHNIVVKLDGHLLDKSVVTLAANEQKSLDFTLEPIPARPEMLWGHIAFWSGVGLVAAGGAGLAMALSYRDDYNARNLVFLDPDPKSRIQTWTGVMYAGFGSGTALIVTGIVLWCLAPDERSWADQAGGYLATTADGDGVILTLGRRW